MTSHPHPSSGGAYVRETDGSLRRVEDEPAEAPVQDPVETPVEEAVKAPAKRIAKEA